jgi:hypothetical protein
MAQPSGQSPSPLSELMCPTDPIFTKRLPHPDAQARANARLPYGSLELAITMLGNPNEPRGTGEKPVASEGKPIPSGLGGATSKAPLIVRLVRADQWATQRHPRLCATRTGLSPIFATTCSRTFTYSWQTGFFQSRCCTRTKSEFADSHNVCQWSWSELPIPGTMRVGIFTKAILSGIFN